MTLYVLTFENGLDFDDYLSVDLGHYTSPELREAASERYEKLVGRKSSPWPFCYERGYLSSYEIETDFDHYAPVTREAQP